MRNFFIVWIGQLGSVVGSALTSFALGVYVYQRNGSATEFALIQFFSQLVFFLATPAAGVLVDRWNRRLAMILSDGGAGVCTLAMFALVYFDKLSLPFIYLLVSISAGFNAIQFIAYKAAITQLVPKEHYGRASGLVDMAGGIAQILAPVIAGFLMSVIHLKGIIMIDVVTFSFALLTLAIIRIPNPKDSGETDDTKDSFWKEAFFGWGYVRARPGLFLLLIYFALSNFLVSTITVLATPMILSFGTAEILGSLLTVCGFGLLVGSLVMGVWGGPKRLVDGIFFFQLVSGLAAMAVGFTTSFVWIGVGGFIFFFTSPMITGCSQAIWQKKVPENIQGRVFSIRQLVAFSAIPLAFGISGPLADGIFEPLMVPDGPLSASLGPIIGTGPGRGIGLLLIIYGAAFSILTLIMWRNKTLRNVETDIPDADASDD